MIDDVQLNKSAIIRRCLERVREEYRGDPERLEDYTIQDSIMLNLLRACEASIDLAMHEVAIRSLGIPQSSRDAFGLLEQANILKPEISGAMKHMCGFRNIAVHSYQEVQLSILSAILDRHLSDIEAFVEDIIGSR